MKHMTGIKRMTHQSSDCNSSPLKGVRSAKRLVGNYTYRVSLLSALLLFWGGTIKLAAQAYPAPSTVIAQTPVDTNVLYVNPTTGTDTNGAGTSTQPLRTITRAFQQARAGTVVQLANGIYTVDTGEVFPLVVPQGVTLKGDESSQGQTVTILGGGNYVSRLEASQDVTIRAEQDSVISGITISNPNRRGSGLWIESTNTTAKNNTFANNKREGIYITGTAAPLIENNIFTKNNGNGITIGRTSKGEIRNNLFQDTGYAIAIGDKASPLVTKNRIIQNRSGVVVSSEAAPVLRNNFIENNTEDGVVIISNGQPDLGTKETSGQNRIRGNTRYDVNNSTKSNIVLAYGNDIDQQRIRGNVEFAGAQLAKYIKDIQGHWAQAYIEALSAKGIIAGFNDGTFRPSEPVTRAQFAAIINKAFTPVPSRSAVNFADVSSKSWAYQPIQAAYRGGFVSGYPENKFLPEQAIPRVQVLVSLASGLKLQSDNTSVLSVYTDASAIPNYARTAVAGATTKQLVLNYPMPNQLNPNRNATRAEVAAFVYQALVNAGRADAIPSNYLVKNP
ncbi:MAG TPA: DUF1565 domain-containing protein [Candidatus Obscuribacterales bacterium]